MCVCGRTCTLSCSVVSDSFVTSWTIACQASLSQARIMEWVVISYSKRSSQPRCWTHISCFSCTGRQILCHWATWEALIGQIYIQMVMTYRIQGTLCDWLKPKTHALFDFVSPYSDRWNTEVYWIPRSSTSWELKSRTYQNMGVFSLFKGTFFGKWLLEPFGKGQKDCFYNEYTCGNTGGFLLKGRHFPYSFKYLWIN